MYTIRNMTKLDQKLLVFMARVKQPVQGQNISNFLGLKYSMKTKIMIIDRYFPGSFMLNNSRLNIQAELFSSSTNFKGSVRYFSNEKHRSNENAKHLPWWRQKEIRTIPNMITLSRIIASPLLAWTIIADMKYMALTGCAIFAFTDWLDGYLAKSLNQATVLGAFLDPLADKFMIGALTAGLVYQNLIPVSLASLIIGRDLFLLACSFIIRGAERPLGAEFFDTLKSATFQIIPSDISKVNTGVQFVLIGTSLSHFCFAAPTIEILQPLWYITAITTGWSGLGYLDGSGLKFFKKKLQK